MIESEASRSRGAKKLLALATAWFGASCVWVIFAAQGGTALRDLPSLLLPTVMFSLALAWVVFQERRRWGPEARQVEPLPLGAGLGVLLTLTVLVWACYRSALQSGFFQDDWRLLYYAEQVVSLGPVSGAYWLLTERLDMMYRPAAWFATALDQWIWDGDPFGFHLSNLGWHVLVSWLVFLLGRRVLGGTGAGLAAALLYALHPLHAEAVTYVTVREESIAAAGFLGAILFYLESRATGRRREVILGLLCGAVALLSKEHTVTLPIALLFAEWLLVDRTGTIWSRLRPLFPYVGLLILFLVLRMWVLGGNLGYQEPTGFNPHLDVEFGRVLGALFSGVPTVLMVPLPFTLAEEGGSFVSYGVLKGVIGFSAALLMLSIAMGRGHVPWRVLAFVAIWPILTIMPVATLLPPIDDLYRMRYYYLPAVGWALGIVLLGQAATTRPMIRGTLFVFFLGYLAWGRGVVAAPWIEEGFQARCGAETADALVTETLASTDSIFVADAPDAVSRALYYRLRRVVPDPPTVVGINRSMQVHEIDTPASAGHPVFHPASLGRGHHLFQWDGDRLVERTEPVAQLHARAMQSDVLLPSWTGAEMAAVPGALHGAAEWVDAEGSLKTYDEGERPWLEWDVPRLDGVDVWAVRVRASLRYEGDGAEENALRTGGEDLVWELGARTALGDEITIPFAVPASTTDGDWVVEVGRHPAWLVAQDIDRLMLNMRGPAQRVSIREITCLRGSEIAVD